MEYLPKKDIIYKKRLKDANTIVADTIDTSSPRFVDQVPDLGYAKGTWIIGIDSSKNATSLCMFRNDYKPYNIYYWCVKKIGILEDISMINIIDKGVPGSSFQCSMKIVTLIRQCIEKNPKIIVAIENSLKKSDRHDNHHVEHMECIFNTLRYSKIPFVVYQPKDISTFFLGKTVWLDRKISHYDTYIEKGFPDIINSVNDKIHHPVSDIVDSLAVCEFARKACMYSTATPLHVGHEWLDE